MNEPEELFPFKNIPHAWREFTKYARMHLARVLRQAMKIEPSIKDKFIKLKNKDFCARLLYIIDMCANPDSTEALHSEFNIDWALLFARPSSAVQARQALKDLVQLGFIEQINDENEGTDFGTSENGPNLDGGDAGPRTDFDFEQN